MARIGIFGGSFNPPHRGHLKLASHALSELNLDRVIFVPSCRTPLKRGQDLLPADLRLRLLRAAVKKYPAFSVSDCEIRRRGVSFTVDTLRYFKRKFGRNTVLYFLAGADTLANLSCWRSPKRIFELCRFVVFTRPRAKVRRLPPQVFFVPFDALDVSASDLRRRLETARPVGALLPSGTARLLREHYRKNRFQRKRSSKSNRPKK